MADWLHVLGDIPPERILCDPWMGTATEADLLKKLDGEDKRLCELVDGTLVEKPMGFYESLIATILIGELLNFIRPGNLGVVSSGDGPLRLRMGLVRMPDVAFVSRARLRAAGGVKEQIPSLIPDLAVEVLSPSNSKREMDRKRKEYFGAGVRLVWQIDPPTRTADVYISSNEPLERLTGDGMLKGRDVLPGFELRLSDLFAAADRMLELGQ